MGYAELQYLKNCTGDDCLNKNSTKSVGHDICEENEKGKIFDYFNMFDIQMLSIKCTIFLILLCYSRMNEIKKGVAE